MGFLYNIERKLRGKSVQTQLMVVFSMVTLVTVIVIFAITLGSISVISSLTENNASDALSSQVKQNLAQKAFSSASQVDRFFERAQTGVVALLAESASKAMSDNYPIKKGSDQEDFAENYVQDTSACPTCKDGVSWYYFGCDNDCRNQYLSPDAVSSAPDLSLFPLGTGVDSTVKFLLDDHVETIDRSERLDLLFTHLLDKNPSFVSIYVGFDDGILRKYKSSTLTGSGEAVSDLEDRYCPTARDWYKDAVSADDDPIYDGPYVDAFGQGVIITIAKKFSFEVSGTTRVGVVGLDMTIDTLQESLNDIQFISEGGYAALVLESDGTLIAHPEWDGEGVGDGADADKEVPKLKDIDTLAWNHFSDIKSKAGTGDVITADSVFIGSAKVSSVAEYLLYMVEPEDGVLEPVTTLKDDISSAQSSVAAATVTMSIVMILIIVAVVVFIARSLVRRLQDLGVAAKQITNNTGATSLSSGVTYSKKSVDPFAKGDEVDELGTAFQDMLNYLRKEEESNKASAKFPPNPYARGSATPLYRTLVTNTKKSHSK